MNVRVLQGCVVFCLLLVIASCGGGDSKSESTVTLKGIVQKGLFTDLNVSVIPIDSTSVISGAAISVTSTDSTYEVQVPSEGLYQIEATGTFTSEVTGQSVTLSEPIRNIVNITADDVAAGQVDSNVNVYTELVTQQTLGNISDSVPISAALPAATLFVQQSLGLANSIDFSQLDITAINENTALSDPNLQLLLLSAALLSQNSNTDSETGISSFSLTTVLPDFGNIPNVEQAATALGSLSGLSAANLYQLAQAVIPNLPINIAALTGVEPVFECQILTCGWRVYTQRTASLVGGSELLESKAKSTLLIQLSSPVENDIQILLSSSDDGAVKGVDYIPISEIITIPAGSDRYSYNLYLLLDAEDEAAEAIRYTIDAIGDDYIIANGSKKITIKDGFGAAENNLSADAKISSVCLSAIGDGLNITSQGCLSNSELIAIPQKISAALAVDLSIEVNCSRGSAAVCEPRKKDWLVGLTLQAVDASNQLQASEAIGDFWFSGKNLHDAENTGSGFQITHAPVETVYAHITTAMLQLFEQAKNNNLTVSIKANLEEVNALSTALIDTVQQPLLLPDRILAGDIPLIYQLKNIEQTDSCNGTNFLITADFTSVINRSSNVSALNTASVCVELNTDVNGVTTAQLLAGYDIPLAGKLIPLPDFHSAHLAYGDQRIQTLGAGYLVIPSFVNESSEAPETLTFCNLISCYKGQDLELTAENPREKLSIYLHVEALPFAYKIISGKADSEGIVLTYSKHKYLQDTGFDRQDPRANGELRSNDIFYKSVENIGGRLRLNTNGITELKTLGAPTVLAASGKTAFPKTELSWDSFDIDVINSKLANVDFQTQVILKQSPKCENCAEVNSIQHILNGQVKFDASGVLLGHMRVSAGDESVPRWGQVIESGVLPVGQQRTIFSAFKRPNDLQVSSTAVFALPGFVFVVDENDGLDIDLLGHVKQINNALVLNNIKTDSSIDGNDWPTGITVGPEIYSNESRLPLVGNGRSLDSSDIIINNGIDEKTLAVNEGAKYVIRNAGITGVFNVAVDAVSGTSLPFYGYDMRFKRFAFTQVNNSLNKNSWIDGLIHLPGKDEPAAGNANFNTEFTSLTLGCDAKFAGGNVTYCGDASCQQSLEAWKTNTDIINMAFSGTNGEPESCVIETQKLTLEQDLLMHALDKKLGIVNAVWSADGQIKSSSFAQFQDLILDAKPNSLTPTPGFAFRPNTGGLRLLQNPTNTGVIDLLDSGMSVTDFWQQIKADIRISNTSANAGSDPSVVVAAGRLANITDDTNVIISSQLKPDGRYDHLNPDAEYTWGSRLKFKLPVYYTTAASIEPSSFIGRYKETDLLIMQAGAGIDYIRPFETKLSFGMSAEIPKVVEFPFRVDLTDIESLRKVDSTLASAGISLNLEETFTLINPLQPLLKDIFRLGNNGIDSAIENTLNDLLTQAEDIQINGVDVNVWQEITEPVVALQSLSSQIDAVVNENISQQFQIGIIDESVALKASLQQLEIALSNPAIQSSAILSVSVGSEIRNDILKQIDFIRASLSILIESTETLSLEVMNVNAQAIRLIDQVGLEVGRLNNALNEITSDAKGLLQAVSINQQLCSDSSINIDAITETDFKLLSPALKQVKNIDAALQGMTNISNVVNELAALYSGEAELERQFRQTVNNLKIEAEHLKMQWTSSAQTFRNNICSESPENYVFNAIQELEQLRTQVNQFNAATIEQIKINVNAQFVEQGVFFKQFESALNGFDNILINAENTITNPQTPMTVAEFHQQILIDPLIDLSTELSTPGAGINFEINALYSADATLSQDIGFALILPIQSQLNISQQSLRETLSLGASLSLPGAYFSPDKYKVMIIKRIMSSRPVVDIRVQANQYLQSYINKIIDFQLVINDQINIAVRTQLSKTLGPLNDAIAAAAAELPLPLTAAGIDGGATIINGQIAKIHLLAKWQTIPQDDSMDGNNFESGFTISRYTAQEGSAEGCNVSPGDEAFDALISFSGPMDLTGSRAGRVNLELGFMFNLSNDGVSAFIPAALNGSIGLEGEMNYEPFTIYDFAFMSGIGSDEVYVGAGGSASFDNTALDLYAFLGRTCDSGRILKLDSRAKDLLKGVFAKDKPFTGIYTRGGATIPLIDTGGCLLNVSAVANIGAWLTVVPTAQVGGIVGGGVTGVIACIGSVRGEVNTQASINAQKEVTFVGEAFAVGGAGFDCDRGTWTNVARSRNDDWCGTADVRAGVRYENNAWTFDADRPSAIH